MNRFVAARSLGLGRKVLWLALAAIVVMLGWASVARSQDSGTDWWLYGTRGMPRPDGFLKRVDPNTGNHYDYEARARRDGSIVISRNGKTWVTLSTKNNDFMLSDPNGGGMTVVRMFQSPSRGGAAAPVKIRAQGR
ncbi:MAG: hypothetical protein QOF71_2644 [Candidatus Eremiobacteraeota bacterium]|jgi:hypothetical protein|nr:hypothetical protein [Candidatus Eremiobacteraeota bacterium]